MNFDRLLFSDAGDLVPGLGEDLDVAEFLPWDRTGLHPADRPRWAGKKHKPRLVNRRLDRVPTD